MLKVAIVGAGMMGKTHARAYASIPGCAVSAIVDTNPQAGKPLADESGGTYLKSLSELGGVDLIDICLPTNLHLAVIEESARLCKNIVCEKPLAVSREEISRAKALVEQYDLTFMVAHVLRFMNDYNKVRMMIADGILGRPTSFVCYRRQRPPVWSDNNWLMDENRSGGLAYDLIIHDIDYVSWIMGMPRRVFGVADYNVKGQPVHFRAELMYEGCTASIFGSWGMPDAFGNEGFISSLEVIGDKAMAYISSDGRRSITGETGTENFDVEAQNPYTSELEYMINCIRKGSKPELSDIYAAEKTLEIVKAVCDSSKSGQAIELFV